MTVRKRAFAVTRLNSSEFNLFNLAHGVQKVKVKSGMGNRNMVPTQTKQKEFVD